MAPEKQREEAKQDLCIHSSSFTAFECSSNLHILVAQKRDEDPDSMLSGEKQPAHCLALVLGASNLSKK